MRSTTHQAARASICLLFMTLLLPGCTAGGSVKQNEPEATLVALQKSATQAYLAQDWQQATEYYREITARDPNDPRAWFKLANTLVRTGYMDAAVSAYRKSLDIEPAQKQAWHNMSILQLRQAADSFLRMQVYLEQNDPRSEQAHFTFEMIRGILQRYSEQKTK